MNNQEQLRKWIGRRVVVRPGAPKEIVGSLGEVVATQFHPLGWVLCVKLDKEPDRERYLNENQVRDDGPATGPAPTEPPNTDDWPNTHGRVVDAAGNALTSDPSAVAQGETAEPTVRQGAYDYLAEQYRTLERENAALKQQLAAKSEELETLASELAPYRDKSKGIGGYIDSLLCDKLNAEAASARLTARVAELEAELTAVNSDLDESEGLAAPTDGESILVRAGFGPEDCSLIKAFAKERDLPIPALIRTSLRAYQLGLLGEPNIGQLATPAPDGWMKRATDHAHALACNLHVEAFKRPNALLEVPDTAKIIETAPLEFCHAPRSGAEGLVEDTKLWEWAENHPEDAMGAIESWWATAGRGGREIEFNFRGAIRAALGTYAANKEGKV